MTAAMSTRRSNQLSQPPASQNIIPQKARLANMKIQLLLFLLSTTARRTHNHSRIGQNPVDHPSSSPLSNNWPKSANVPRQSDGTSVGIFPAFVTQKVFMPTRRAGRISI
jgi:hypothetical protein